MEKKRKYLSYLILSGLCLIAVIVAAGWRWYMGAIEKNELGELLNAREYGRHYVMIPEESSSKLWQDIYASAQSAAAEADAYVEFLADWTAGGYTASSYIDIAIAANVDGIIVKPDGTAQMRNMINKADEAGIPVITVLDDDTDSARKSFVGINSYQMGTIYGNQILECIDDTTQKITVLLNHSDSGKDLIFKELKATVQAELTPQQNSRIEIVPLTISSSSTFDAEEVIRDLINKEEERPDILVCMNETDSSSAYHAMVDYNQVGDIDIIGYYASDTMLSAVQKGTVPMAITLDTEQMGQCSVEALEEYYSMGYVSNYFSVDLDIITQQNVQSFLDEDQTGAQVNR